MSESTMKMLRVLTAILICLAIAASFFISIIKVFGFDIYGVMTGSMKPAISPGSLIYVREADPERLRIGDVITYSVSPYMIATHRIVDIVVDESNPVEYCFQTKGDANQMVDVALVEPRKIIGKVAFSLPFIGYVANYIQKPPGLFVAMLVSLFLIFMVFLTDSTTLKTLSNRQKKKTEIPAEQANAPVYPVPQNGWICHRPSQTVSFHDTGLLVPMENAQSVSSPPSTPAESFEPEWPQQDESIHWFDENPLSFNEEQPITRAYQYPQQAPVKPPMQYPMEPWAGAPPSHIRAGTVADPATMIPSAPVQMAAPMYSQQPPEPVQAQAAPVRRRRSAPPVDSQPQPVPVSASGESRRRRSSRTETIIN